MLRKKLKIAALGCLLVLSGAGALLAEEVILKPGYLTGRVSLGSNYQVSSFNINAYGGGYTSSLYPKDTADYSLTVQGGPWDYRVVTSAYFSGGNGTQYVSFSDRYVQVGSGATVLNDYVFNPGIVRFEVTIAGDAYAYWQGYSKGEMTAAAGAEKTYTSMSTHQFHADSAWEMAVVPNQQVQLTSTLYIDGPGYNDLTSFNFNFGTKDIAPGEVVVIPIHIDYVAPEPQQPPTYPPPSTRYYGYLEGTAWLKNVPDNDVWFHSFIAGGSRVGSGMDNPGPYRASFSSTNPNGTYLADIRVGTYISDRELNRSGAAFLWPYPEGDPQKAKVQVAIGTTTNKDYILETGVLAGKLNLRGPVRTEDLSSGIYPSQPSTIRFESASESTSGGLGNYMLHPANETQTYQAYLSEGAWRVGALSLRRYVVTPTPYSTTLGVNYLDQDEANKDLGLDASPQVIPGQTTYQDIDYCLGDVIYRFRDASGGLLSTPRIDATGKRVINGKTVMTATVLSASSAVNASMPQLEIYGPPGRYDLSSQVTAEDGSLIRYPLMTKDLVCGVQEIIDIPGPTLRVTSPASGTITNADFLTVTGVVASPSTVTGVVVGDEAAVLGATGDPDTVTFDRQVTLAEGVNTIVTTAVDASGAQASDSRIIFVDRWQPEVTINTPGDGALFWYQQGAIPVQVAAADQGYGHTLTLYLDGEAIYLVEESGDDSAPVAKTYNRNIGPLTVGEHVLTAEVVDRAGNTASISVAVTSFLDNWPPVVEIATPAAGNIFSGSDAAIPLAVQAADQGSGFTLSVALDGAPLTLISGPANLLAPAMVTFSDLVGPLSSGLHLLEAVVTDSAGNSASASQTFQVDGWQPQVSILSPADGNLFAGSDEAIPLVVTASDRGYGYVLNVYVDGALTYSIDGAADDTTPAAVGISELLGPLSSGEHVVRAVVVDAAGNRAAEEVTIFVDGWLPEIAVFTPGDGSFFASTDAAVPVNIEASDQGYGFTLEVYLDGNLLASTDGAGSATGVETVTYGTVLGPLATGDHQLVAVVRDAAGNQVSRSARIVSYLAVEVTVKPEASHNAENGTSTIFVQLPEEIGGSASLQLTDNREVTADPAQFPYDVRRSSSDGRLVLKFNRTPELMADDFYTVEGKYFPNPSDPSEFYYWRGSDTTKW